MGAAIMSELSISEVTALDNNQINDDFAKLERLYSRWLVGDGGVLNVNELPSDFAKLLQATPETKKSLFALAIASQYQTLMLGREPTPLTDDDMLHIFGINPLEPLPIFPTLGLPVVPTGLQPLVRRILATFSKHTDIAALLLLFLLSRGYVVSPMDAMPVIEFWGLMDSVPAVYEPWEQWQQCAMQLQSHIQPVKQFDQLTLENWQDWYPSELAKTLKQLRQTDPAQAFMLVSEIIKVSKADIRLLVVSSLAVNQRDSDIPLLQSLTADRSQKVVSLAKQLLARLGVFAQDDDSNNKAVELADGFEVKKAVLKSYRLAPKKLKSGKQMAIRTEQLGQVFLPDFAKALGLSMAELITAWQFGDHQPTDNRNLLDNMTATLSQADFSVLVNHLSEYIVKNPSDFGLINRLAQRLDKSMRLQVASRLLKANISFDEIARLADGELVVEKLEQITQSAYWQGLCGTVQKQLTDSGYIADWEAMQLQMLGLLVSQGVAKALFDKLVDMGVPRTDNGLMVLNLNQRLAKNG